MKRVYEIPLNSNQTLFLSENKAEIVGYYSGGEDNTIYLLSKFSVEDFNFGSHYDNVFRCVLSDKVNLTISKRMSKVLA